MDLLEPTPLAEFYAVIKPDGTCRLVDTKLDVYEGEQIGLIYRAAMLALTEWAARHGAHVGFIVGDGGPEYVKLKARLYQQAEELATLRAKVATLPATENWTFPDDSGGGEYPWTPLE